MAALHNLCWDFLFSRQMICKQHIVLNHVFFRYESNLKPITVMQQIVIFICQIKLYIFAVFSPVATSGSHQWLAYMITWLSFLWLANAID